MGNTLNAVKTQIYCTIITYCLVAIIRKELKIVRLNYEILQILGNSLLKKAPVNELLTLANNKKIKEQFSNQLALNLI